MGSTTFTISNQSDQALGHVYSAASAGEPRVLTTDIPPSAATDILRTSGCFGCSDPPSFVFSTFQIVRASDGFVAIDLSPVVDSDWTSVSLSSTDGEYDAQYELTVTQAMVDSAVAP